MKAPESMCARLARVEISLTIALDKVAMLADDDPPLFWFGNVFREWMRPQGFYRRHSVRSVLLTAVSAINDLENPDQDFSI